MTSAVGWMLNTHTHIYTVMELVMLFHDSIFTFDWIVKLAGIMDRHKFSDKIEFDQIE